MKRFLVTIALIFVAGWLAGYVLFGRPSLQARAVAAYNAGEYDKALPLFKEYAQTTAVRNDAKSKQLVMAYIFDITQKLSSKSSTMAASVPAASGPSQSSDLMAQALSFALQQNASPSDPPMGADRVPHKKPQPGETLAMSIKEMANFNFDPMVDTDVPPDVRLLDGAHVRLSGFMIPQTQAAKIDKFALVPSLVGCCFGAPPGVQHIVTCYTAADKALDYSIDELSVEGILHIKVKRQEGYTSDIFELEVTGAKVKG